MSKHPPLTVSIGGFSTNNDKYSSLSLISLFYESTLCNNVDKVKKNHIKFDYYPNNTNGALKVQCNFIEISNLEKQYHICKSGDCFVLFVDLEHEDSFDKCKDICEYITTYCLEDREKKTHVIGVYTDEDKIIEEFNEDDDDVENKNLQRYLQDKHMVFDYNSFYRQDEEDLITIFENLIDDTINNQSQLKQFKDLIEKDQNSTSCCLF